jgi:hypothetical protein
MRISSLMTSCFVLSVAATTAAHAQSIGYVGTLGGELSSAESYNSAGEANSVAIIGTGIFEVTLAGLGNGLDSDVQVNAVNTDGTGHYCTSGGWYSSNDIDVTAYVYCFDSAGNPLSEDFSLLYQARTTAPPSGSIAFLWADKPTISIGSGYKPDSSYSYNSTGGTNTVKHEGTGMYRAHLPGLNKHGNVQVTAYGGGAARCEVAKWSASGSETIVNVYCVNAANVATDEYFDLSYTEGTTEAAGPSATAKGAYAWADNDTKKSYVPSTAWQFNSLSSPDALKAERFGGAVPGQYSLTLPNPSNVGFNTYLGMVTANGTSGEYCDTAGLNVEAGDIYVDLICYDSEGIQVDAMYTGTLIFSN